MFAFQPSVAVDERGNALAIWTVTDTVKPPTSLAVGYAFRPRM